MSEKHSPDGWSCPWVDSFWAENGEEPSEPRAAWLSGADHVGSYWPKADFVFNFEIGSSFKNFRREMT